MEQVNSILEKYNHFIDARIRRIESGTDESKIVTMVIEDDEGEDLHTIILTFKNIKEARILQNSVLSFMDMVSGISIIKDHGLYGFAIGHGTAMLHVHNAPLYIIAKDIFIEEK